MAEEKKSRLAQVFAIGLLMMGGCFVCIHSVDPPNKGVESKSSIHIKAWLTAQRIMTSQLKTPSTAEYPSYNESFVQDYEYEGQKAYKVSAYVDAQNTFGAQVRTRWIIVLNNPDMRLLHIETY